MLLADVRRNARQKDPGKYRHIEAKALLRQEAIFCGEFNVAETAQRRAGICKVVCDRQRGGELQVRCPAVIEVDTSLAVDAVSRRHAIGERVNLEVPVVGGFGIIGQIGRACLGGETRYRQ